MHVNFDGISIVIAADVASNSHHVCLIKDGQTIMSTQKDAAAMDVLGKDKVFAFAAAQLAKRFIHEALRIAAPEEEKAEEA